jgi:WD40 repeat protein
LDEDDSYTEFQTEWDPRTGRTTALPPRKVANPWVRWTADETRYLTTNWSAANLFDARTGLAIRGFAVDDRLWRAEIDPAGERVFAVTDQQLTVWGSDGTRRATIPLRSPVNSNEMEVAIFPDGRSVATLHRGFCSGHSWTGYRPRSSSWTDLSLWDSDTGRSRHTIRLSDLWSRPVFSADGRYFIADPPHNLGKAAAFVNIEDISVQPALFDAATGRQLYVLPVAKSWLSLPYQFSPDSRTLAVGQEDGKLLHVEVSSGKVLAEFDQDEMIQQLRFSPDGRWLVTGTANGVLVWDVQTKRNQPVAPPRR